MAHTLRRKKFYTKATVGVNHTSVSAPNVLFLTLLALSWWRWGYDWAWPGWWGWCCPVNKGHIISIYVSIFSCFFAICQYHLATSTTKGSSNLRNDADKFWKSLSYLDFVTPAGKIAEGLDGHAHVSLEGQSVNCSGVDGFDGGQLLLMLLHQVSQPVDGEAGETQSHSDHGTCLIMWLLRILISSLSSGRPL